MARSHFACVALPGFGCCAFLRPGYRLQMLSLLTGPTESSRGALRHLGFGLSASASRLHSRGLPSRLTSRSSRRRVVASLKLPDMRAILAPIRRVRRGLTPALGGRKAFFSCVGRKPDFLASVNAALRRVSPDVASSVKSIWRAHTSHAWRWPVLETVIGRGQCSATGTAASVTSG